jgi:hypothetical protein
VELIKGEGITQKPGELVIGDVIRRVATYTADILGTGIQFRSFVTEYTITEVYTDFYAARIAGHTVGTRTSFDKSSIDCIRVNASELPTVTATVWTTKPSEELIEPMKRKMVDALSDKIKQAALLIAKIETGEFNTGSLSKYMGADKNE